MKDEQVRLVSGQVRSDIKVRSVVRGGTGPLEREKLGAFGIVVCDMEKKALKVKPELQDKGGALPGTRRLGGSGNCCKKEEGRRKKERTLTQG